MKWREIQNHKGYLVNEFGWVKRLEQNYTDSLGRKCHKPEKIFYPKKALNGYMRTSLGRTRQYTHILIAQAFIPNPHNYDTVDHINGIKSDNRPSNLRWLSREQNIKEGFKLGLYDRSLREVNKEKRENYWNKNHACYQIDPQNDNIIREWSSPKEAAVSLDINYTGIIKCLHGQRNTAGKYKWKYK